MPVETPSGISPEIINETPAKKPEFTLPNPAFVRTSNPTRAEETIPLKKINLVEPNPGRNLEKEDFDNTAELLKFTEENSGFLPLNHPLVTELQGILNKSQDPNSKGTRLLVALNDSESNAFCLPDDTLVLNMSTIHDLDYVEEVVAVLAHEQGHSEKGHLKTPVPKDSFTDKTLKGRLGHWVASQGHGRKAEYQADFVSLSKLDSLGYDSMAFTSAIRKIGRRNPSQAADMSISHGSSNDRALNAYYAHALIDYPSSAQGAESWHKIPAEWKIDYQASLAERLFKTEDLSEWRALINEASPGVLTEHIREVFYDLYNRVRSSIKEYRRIKSDHVTKLAVVFNLLEKRVEDSNLSPAERSRAVVLGLTEATGISLDNWRDLHGWLKPGRGAAIFGPISYAGRLARAQLVNIDKYASGTNETVEHVTSILNLHQNKAIYESLGLSPPKSEYPGSFLDFLEYPHSLKDKKKGLEGPLPDDVIANINNLKQVQSVISERFGEARGKTWLGKELDQLVKSYIHINRPYDDNLITFKRDDFIRRTGQLLEYIRENTEYTFNIHNLERYSNSVGYKNKDIQAAFNLFKELVYRPDAEFSEIFKTQNSEAFKQYLKNNPEKFNQQLALLYNNKTFSPDERAWLLKNLSAENLSEVNLNSEIKIPEYISQELAKLPFEYKTEGFSQTEIQNFNRIHLALESLVVISSGQNAELRLQLFSDFFSQDGIQTILKDLPFAFNDYLVRYINSEVQDVLQGMGNIPAFSTESKYDLMPLSVEHNRRLSQMVVDHNGTGDRLINLPAFRVLREKALDSLNLSSGLEAAISSHTYVNTLFIETYKNIVDNIWGMSPEASVALAPFVTRLFSDLSQISLEGTPDEQSILLYNTLRDKLPQDLYNKGVIDKLFTHVLLNLPYEQALNFLEQEAIKRRVDFKSIDLFIDQKMHTIGDFRKSRDTLSRVIDKVMQEDDSAEGKLVLGDVITNSIIEARKSPVDLLKAMMETSSGDSSMRESLVTAYWNIMGARKIQVLGKPVLVGNQRGWEIEINGNEAKVVGPGAYLFHPFNDLISRFYRSSAIEKNILLRKLFLNNRNGILISESQQSKLAEAVTGSLAYDKVLTPLFGKIVTSAVKACDPIKIFHPLAGSLAETILQVPQTGPDNGSAASTLMTHIHEQERSGNLSQLVSRVTNTGVAYGGVKNFLDLSRDAVEKSAAERPEVKPMFNLYENLMTNIATQVGFSGDKKPEPQAKKAPIEIVLQVGQAMGPVGKRFLQVLDQYIDLDPEQAQKFREVYDSNPGQSKFTAFSTIERLSKTDQETKAFVDDELVSIDEKLGGGALMTTFKIHTKDRNGKLQTEVLKVKNPNAERFVLETVEQSELVIAELLRSDPSNNANYQMAQRLLVTIKEWVLGDINDTKFLSLDEVFYSLHNGFKTSEGVEVSVPETRKPHNLYLQREALAPGRTVNKVMADAETQEGEMQLRRAVRASAELFARSLTIPAIDVDTDSPKYIARSDLHPGNDIYDNNTNRLSPIDRHYYLELNQADVNFLKTVISDMPAQDKLAEVIRFTLSQEENRGLGLNVDNVTNQVKRSIGLAQVTNFITRRDTTGNSVQLMNKVLGEMDKRGIVIPLKIRLLIKNLDSVNHQLQIAGLGSFSQYLAA